MRSLPAGLTRKRWGAQEPCGIARGSLLSLRNASASPSGLRVNCTADASARYFLLRHKSAMLGSSMLKEKNHRESLIAKLVKKIGKKRKLRMDRSIDFLRDVVSKKLSMSSVSRPAPRVSRSPTAAASAALASPCLLPTSPKRRIRQSVRLAFGPNGELMSASNRP